MQLLHFAVLPGSAEAQVIWCGIVICVLISYFIDNTPAKKYQNPLTCQSYSKPKEGRFLSHGVEAFSELRGRDCLANCASQMSHCGLQVLYNIRPQAVTADDLVGTAYDARLKDSKLARHMKMRQTRSARRYWPFVLGLLASAAFMLIRQYRRSLPV